MPIRDQAAQERSLDNDYGVTRGPNSPDSFEVVLFVGDPDLGGTEVPASVEGEGTGYARATLDNDAWLTAVAGVKESQPIAFADALAEWPDTVTHAALYDPIGGAWWDCVPLAEPLDVTGPGEITPLVFSIFYDTNLD